jgi:membrane protease YdiL (CAAX protease family)
VNNSTSTIFAGSQTHWPSESFRRGRTIGLILAAIGVGIVAAVAGIAVMFAVPSLRAPSSFITTALVFQLAIEGLPVLVILAALPRVSGLSYRELGFYVPRPWQVGVAMLGAVAMIVVVEGGASLIQTLLHQKHEQQVVEMFKQVRRNAPVMWFFAVFAIVLAPFMEETIFRLFVFNAARRHWGFWIGAIVSGACFGAAHLDKFVFVPLALGGIILAYVYKRTGNAFCSMMTHGLFNAATVLALIFVPKLAQ